MKIHVYVIMRDEIQLLPFFLRHYETIADTIFVHDGGSVDGSREMLERHPKVYLLSDVNAEIDDMSFRTIHQQTYKDFSRGRADWVICVDADEFVYHPYLHEMLNALKNDSVEIVQCDGWSMFSEHFPETNGQIYDAIKLGINDSFQGKPVVFQPKIDIAFSAGRHSIRLASRDQFNIRAGTGIKLLHYRYFGKEYAEARSKRNVERMSERNIVNKLGRHNMDENGVYHNSVKWAEDVKRYATRCI